MQLLAHATEEIVWTKPPTDDDVPITLDGTSSRHIAEKVSAFLREINEQRAAEHQRDG